MKVRHIKRGKQRAFRSPRCRVRRWLDQVTSEISKAFAREFCAAIPPVRNWFSLDLAQDEWRKIKSHD